jgi:hypothetical protein
LEVSIQYFKQLEGCEDFLRLFIWSRFPGLKRFHDGCDKGAASKFCENLGGNATETPEMISKVKTMRIIFHDIKGIFRKEFVPAVETINSV